MNLKEMTRLQRIKKIKEIFAYANKKGVTREDIQHRFWIDACTLSRLLNSRIYEKDILDAGVTYKDPKIAARHNIKAARRLTPSEIASAVTLVNSSDTYEEMLDNNPYDPMLEAVHFQWVDAMTKSLWLLKGEKMSIFLHHTYNGMPAPKLFRRGGV